MSGIEGYHEAGMDRSSDPSEDTDTQMHGGGRLPLGGLQLLERPEPSPSGLGSLPISAPASSSHARPSLGSATVGDGLCEFPVACSLVVEGTVRLDMRQPYSLSRGDLLEFKDLVAYETANLFSG